MPYIELYNRVQNLETPITLEWLVHDALELNWVNQIKGVRTPELDESVCRGFIIEDPTHLFGGLVANFVIVTSSKLNRCWERFVFTKELMHVYDKAAAKTDTGEKLDTQLNQLTNVSTNETTSPQMLSEIKALWMALGVSCPEAERLDIKQRVESQDITHRDAAEILKIPEAYIRHLVSPLYETEIHYVLNDR